MERELIRLTSSAGYKEYLKSLETDPDRSKTAKVKYGDLNQHRRTLEEAQRLAVEDYVRAATSSQGARLQRNSLHLQAVMDGMSAVDTYRGWVNFNAMKHVAAMQKQMRDERARAMELYRDQHAKVAEYLAVRAKERELDEAIRSEGPSFPYVDTYVSQVGKDKLSDAAYASADSDSDSSQIGGGDKDPDPVPEPQDPQDIKVVTIRNHKPEEDSESYDGLDDTSGDSVEDDFDWTSASEDMDG